MRIVEQHRVYSRKVTAVDTTRVISEVSEMKKMIVGTCVALAHPQVNDTDPLAFYLTESGEIIINPVITRHSNYTVDSKEGCMTFPNRPAIIHQRWHKIELSYQTIEDDKLTEEKTASLSGFNSFVAQHEIDHLQAKYCYDL